MRAIEAPSTQNLRGWQRRALVKYLAARPRDYLLVATPARERRRSLCASLRNCWPTTPSNGSPWWCPPST